LRQRACQNVARSRVVIDDIDPASRNRIPRHPSAHRQRSDHRFEFGGRPLLMEKISADMGRASVNEGGAYWRGMSRGYGRLSTPKG
jgi:hypothetical protein